jgi:hypothetical protein
MEREPKDTQGPPSGSFQYGNRDIVPVFWEPQEPVSGRGQSLRQFPYWGWRQDQGQVRTWKACKYWQLKCDY